jgi:hypothetical protein
VTRGPMGPLFYTIKLLRGRNAQNLGKKGGNGVTHKDFLKKIKKNSEKKNLKRSSFIDRRIKSSKKNQNENRRKLRFLSKN